MPRFIVAKETKAFGAAQIMISLIHCALGILWLALYHIDEKADDRGRKIVLLMVFYSCISAAFFITSGSSSVIQGYPTTCQLILAIVTNILSVFMILPGMALLCFGFIHFEEKGNEYTWPNLTGMMLVQFTLLTNLSILILASIMIHCARKAFHHEFDKERSVSCSDDSTLEVTICSEYESISHSSSQSQMTDCKLLMSPVICCPKQLTENASQ